MIDSPVGKTADAAVAGTLTLMVGGSARAIVARARPVLDCMGTDFFHCGELGAGQTMKLINNLLATGVSEASIGGAGRRHQGGPHARHDARACCSTTMAWNNAARDRDAQAAARRRLQARLHDEARAQGLPARAADGRGARRRRRRSATRRSRASTKALQRGLADHDVGALLKLREEPAGVTGAPAMHRRLGRATTHAATMSARPGRRARAAQRPAFAARRRHARRSAARGTRHPTRRCAARVRAMYARGLRYFDTAPFYGLGLAEHRLGMCLRDDRPPQRSSLSTKVGRLIEPVRTAARAPARSSGKLSVRGCSSTTATTPRCARSRHSLQRLGTNAIDIVLIHDVNRRWQGDQRRAALSRGDGGRVSRARRDLRAQGAIKAFGVGVNDWSILERFAARRRLRLLHAGRPLHAARPHRARHVPARRASGAASRVLMAAPFNSGILATGAHAGRDVLLHRGASRRSSSARERIEAVCRAHTVSHLRRRRCSSRSRIRRSPASSPACARGGSARERRALRGADPRRSSGPSSSTRA